MRIAIVCDWLVTIGGAEKVLEQLIECFPDADLFAVIDFIEEDKRNFLRKKPIKTTFIQHLPFAKKYYRSYLPLMPIAIEQLDLREYDIIISSSHAVAKGVITHPDQIHISYIHSPMRYAWDLQHQYLEETGLNKKLSGIFARYFLHKLRIWDARSASGVDHMIANSKFIARRIKKTYRRHAEVIYPPIDIDKFQPHREKEDFYLTASRLVPYKKIDLIVESFNDMPDKTLVVIGDGPEFQKIKSKAGSNIKILGYQPDDVLHSHLKRAKAFVFAAEEDFGLMPLEAQACGTPVVAFGKGGALETIRGFGDDEPTGLFFYQQNKLAIVNAIVTFETNQSQFILENCVANAKRFSSSHFKEKFQSFVTNCYATLYEASSQHG